MNQAKERAKNYMYLKDVGNVRDLTTQDQKKKEFIENWLTIIFGQLTLHQRKQMFDDLDNLLNNWISDETIDMAIQNQFNEFLEMLYKRRKTWYQSLAEDGMGTMNKEKVVLKLKELTFVIKLLRNFRNIPQPPKEK